MKALQSMKYNIHTNHMNLNRKEISKVKLNCTILYIRVKYIYTINQVIY